MTGLRNQPDLKAAVLLDPIALSMASTAGSSKPVLLVSEGREEWSAQECELWNNLRGEKRAVLFRGADHFASSDAVWLSAYVPKIQTETGTVGPERTVAVIRSYVTAFFDWQLLGNSPGLLLNALSKESADIITTTSNHRLCTPTPARTARTIERNAERTTREQR
jgi:hypothetical protein